MQANGRTAGVWKLGAEGGAGVGRAGPGAVMRCEGACKRYKKAPRWGVGGGGGGPLRTAVADVRGPLSLCVCIHSFIHFQVTPAVQSAGTPPRPSPPRLLTYAPVPGTFWACNLEAQAQKVATSAKY
jgi:hypothetical protein